MPIPCPCFACVHVAAADEFIVADCAAEDLRHARGYNDIPFRHISQFHIREFPGEMAISSSRTLHSHSQSHPPHPPHHHLHSPLPAPP